MFVVHNECFVFRAENECKILPNCSTPAILLCVFWLCIFCVCSVFRS